MGYSGKTAELIDFPSYNGTVIPNKTDAFSRTKTIKVGDWVIYYNQPNPLPSTYST